MCAHRLTRSLCDPVVYWPVPFDDGHGERQWAVPTACRARFSPAFRRSQAQQNEALEATETVLMDASPLGAMPEPGGYVWRGLLAELVDDRPPIDDNNETIAREIVAVRHVRGRRQRPALLATMKVR